MKIKELREEQARIATNARTKFDEIKSDTPEARATEIEAEFDRMMAEHDKIGSKIERLKKLEEAEGRAAEGDDRRPRGGDGQQRGQEEGDKPTYRHAFAKLMCGFTPEDMTPEERQLLRRGTSNFEQRAQTAGTASAGGYTVPTELIPTIDKAMKAWGPMYDEALSTVITTSGGNSMKLPTVDDTAVDAGTHTEGTALTDDGGKDATLGQGSLDAYGFDSEFIRWSWELDADSIFSFETLLGELIGERLGRIANSQLTIGTGSSAPNGIVTASALGKTSASATAITADEVIDLVHSVDPAYRASPKARFMFNDNTLLALRKLKDGQGNYLITEAPDGSGRLKVGSVSAPYSINQAMVSIAAAKKVMLYGDFSKYYVRKVGAPVIGVLRERFWPDMGIAGLIRFDGEISHSGAIKHLITAAS
ncbi:MAG: capsid protein [Rhodobacterales bacterium RIFCSPHIGHO2_02_FULL_62_130]|nr:MAG: capsid protein [Rhodobacterales bacterium RIFCSPHIGHO2_02_FULL_62_130]OHC53859.1 MAG: capsid protein [Rhodobacterales bacterium RIFCSPHIGHO2_12_FULL_62_75]HCZ00172.1 phage major capsid protein [Rhodobacter sp.]